MSYVNALLATKFSQSLPKQYAAIQPRTEQEQHDGDWVCSV